MKFLIEYGLINPSPDLNGQRLQLDHQTIGGETALMKAAGIGQTDICILLMKSGCNPFLKDSGNMTADQYALIYKKDE